MTSVARGTAIDQETAHCTGAALACTTFGPPFLSHQMSDGSTDSELETPQPVDTLRFGDRQVTSPIEHQRGAGDTLLAQNRFALADEGSSSIVGHLASPYFAGNRTSARNPP
jgi:hypothetical protein